MVRIPYGPCGFPIHLIDSLTDLSSEHETSAGAEHLPLSVHLSRGAFTVCSHKEIDVHLLLLTHSLDCLQSLLVLISWPPMLHFLCALSHIWDSTPSSAVTSTLGGLLFHSVTTLPLLKYSQLFLSCLAEGSLTGMS